MTEKDMLFYMKETNGQVALIIQDSEKISKNVVDAIVENRPKRIILVGSGTSYNATLAVRGFMEKILKIPVQTFPSFNYAHYEMIFCEEDLVFAISQEGESTNTLAAIKKAQEHHIRVVGLTENLNEEKRNTIARTCDIQLDLWCGKEAVGPKTKGYIATVLTLQMATLEIGKALERISEESYTQLKNEAKETVGNFPKVIQASLEWFKKNERDLAKLEKAVIIGYGANYATAVEAGLKALETVRYPFMTFEVEEFLHGPLAVVRNDVYSFFIAPKSEGYERINPLYRAMQVQNKHCYSIGSQDEAINDKRIMSSDHFKNHEDFTVLEYIIPMQALAFCLYKAKDQELYIRECPDVKGILQTKTYQELQ